MDTNRKVSASEHSLSARHTMALSRVRGTRVRFSGHMWVRIMSRSMRFSRKWTEAFLSARSACRNPCSCLLYTSATGRGRVVVRARTEFEEFGQNRTRIIVTEIPYQVNKRMLIKNMADQVEDKRLEGISDIRDESDRDGMRIVVELKKDANPQVVLNRLFAQTQLQTTFAINMLALVNDQSQPKILSLRHMLDEYLKFQEEIIVRRTQYDLKKAQERAHILEGLLIAQDHIDEVIKIIRESYDNAKENLMARFGPVSYTHLLRPMMMPFVGKSGPLTYSMR